MTKLDPSLACARVVHLRPNGEDVPYVVDKDRGDDAWTFDLAYADVALVLEPALTLLAVSRLPPSEADDVLREMRERREDETRFDETRTRDLSERVLFDAPAAQSAPLVREPGRLVVTTARVYFQPLHDVTGCGAVRSHPIAATSAVVRRRKTLRPLGVEIFFARDGGFDGDERGGGDDDDDGAAIGNAFGVRALGRERRVARVRGDGVEERPRLELGLFALPQRRRRPRVQRSRAVAGHAVDPERLRVAYVGRARRERV